MPGRRRDINEERRDAARAEEEERAAATREREAWDRRFPPGLVAYHVALARAAARYLTTHGTLPPGLPRQHHPAARLWTGVPDP